jgi:hypothetical protein
MCQPFLLDLSGRGVEQSDLLKLGMEIYSYNDHRSAPFSRASWLVLPPPTLTRVREPTLSWNQLHSSTWVHPLETMSVTAFHEETGLLIPSDYDSYPMSGSTNTGSVGHQPFLWF